MEFSINPESKLMRSLSIMSNKKKASSTEFNLSNIMGDYNNEEFLMNLCIEIVAHIEVVSFTRILQADF